MSDFLNSASRGDSLQKICLWLLGGIALLGLSHFSGYALASNGSMSFEIATMLTPSGIVNNLLIEKDHFLRPYYFEQVQHRTSILNDGSMMLYVIICAGSSLTLLWMHFGKTSQR